MTNKDIVLLDGGMGQELAHRGAARADRLWGAQVMIDSPALVTQLHKDYIRAGSRVITLNTYSVTPERLADVGREHEFAMLQARAFELAAAARQQAEVPGVRIAASLPPLYDSYHPQHAPPFEQALATYRAIVAEQVGAVDLFICETMSSIHEATAAATAACDSGLPVWVSLSVDDAGSGNLRSAETIADAREALRALDVGALLLNCSLPEAVDAAWVHMHSQDMPTGAYANGFTSVMPMEYGTNVDALQARHDLDPQAYARFAMRWIDSGAAIVGGCCEITPAHIATLASQLRAAGYRITSDIAA